jgi:hypothetical protein
MSHDLLWGQVMKIRSFTMVVMQDGANRMLSNFKLRSAQGSGFGDNDIVKQAPVSCASSIFGLIFRAF